MDKKGVFEMETVTKVMVFLLLLGVIAIAGFLILDSTVPTIKDIESVGDERVNGSAENELTVNGSGYNLQTCARYTGGELQEINALGNSTATNGSSPTLSSTNYTLSGCNVVATSASVYKDTRWNVTSFVFKYKENSQQAVLLQGNFTTGTVRFFKQVPTIFTVLGVVVLLAAIFLITRYVLMFKTREGGL